MSLPLCLLSLVVAASPSSAQALEAPVRVAAAQDDTPASEEVAPELEEGEVLELGEQDDAPLEEGGDGLEEGEVLELEEGAVIQLGDAAGPAPADDDGAAAEAGPGEGEDDNGWDEVERELVAFLDGNWLDPPGEFWAVRRGGRMELSFFVGAEAAAGKFQPGDISVITDFGGVVLNPVGRWYPVDQVAVVMGMRGYLGFGRNAVGTGAQTVLTPYFGVRYDLVKEERLSFLIDVYSGPAAFVFTDLLDTGPTNNLYDRFFPAWALGAEIGGGLVGRYSLGPTTFELRGTVGGRAGSATDIKRPTGDVGPFSAFYAGVDLGITWSFFADGNTSTVTKASDS